jgi:hypothetical protein
MRIWGEDLLNDLICWFIALMKVVRIWQPALDSFKNGVEISLSRMARAPVFELTLADQLSRGPTLLNLRSNL